MNKLLKILILGAISFITPLSLNAVKTDFIIVAGITSSSMTYSIDATRDYDGYDGGNYISVKGGVNIGLTFWKGLGLNTGILYQKIGAKNNWEKYLHRTDLSPITGNYLSVPILPRYVLSIPTIEKIISPSIYTGTVLNFRIQSSNTAFFEEKNVTADWCMGLGALLIQKIDLKVSYNHPLTESFRFQNGKDTIKCRIPYWSFTVGYKF